MALAAVGFGGLAESFLAVVANAAMFILAVRFFRHLQIFLFHLEDFCMAVGAFGLVLVHMGFMAEKNGAGASRGLKLDVPPARLLLLRIGDTECRKGQDTDADQKALPDSFPQNFTSFRCRRFGCLQAYPGNFI